jgi:hypothetical protein
MLPCDVGNWAADIMAQLGSTGNIYTPQLRTTYPQTTHHHAAGTCNDCNRVWASADPFLKAGLLRDLKTRKVAQPEAIIVTTIYKQHPFQKALDFVKSNTT